MLQLAFMGFRHGHIFSLLKHAETHPDVRIAAACEEDPATRETLAQAGTVRITHDSYARLLDEAACDAIAVGDYYGKRGAIAIEALRRGKHVISDKPLCTSLAELEEIQALSARHGLKLGLQLDLRDGGLPRKARELIRAGEIGEVHAIVVTAEHPLMKGSRPGWYFEPGRHGGTINDIAIHAVDLIPWLTGLRFARVEAARAWNAFASDTPWMRDGGQFMATLENGCGVLADVSYFMPDTQGYSLPPYWRLTFFGRQGLLEIVNTRKTLMLARNGEKEPVLLEPAPADDGGYLNAFLADIAGHAQPGVLATADVLAATRTALLLQRAGDEGLAHQPL